jgi:hypothetical protein
MLWKLASCGNYGNFNLSPQDSNPMASDEGGSFIHLNPPPTGAELENFGGGCDLTIYDKAIM